MRYETPELTALTTAINAVQAFPKNSNHTDSPTPNNDSAAAYEDWE